MLITSRPIYVDPEEILRKYALTKVLDPMKNIVFHKKCLGASFRRSEDDYNLPINMRQFYLRTNRIKYSNLRLLNFRRVSI